MLHLQILVGKPEEKPQHPPHDEGASDQPAFVLDRGHQTQAHPTADGKKPR